jgi:hypothetical protein
MPRRADGDPWHWGGGEAGDKKASAFFFEKKKQGTSIRWAVRKLSDLAAGPGEAHRIL